VGLRPLCTGLVLLVLTGCYHWAHVNELDETAGVAQVRIEPAGAPSYVLVRPAPDIVRDSVVNEHARVAIRKLDPLATGAPVTGVTLSVATTVVVTVLAILLLQAPINVQTGNKP
jgi:hypothetical protein